MKLDVVLIEREVSITKEEIAGILNILPDDQSFIPIEIVGDYSAAMGFISYDAADRIDFEYGEKSDFYVFIQGILNDMEKENILCVYDFEDNDGESLRILLTRALDAAVKRLNQPAIGSYCLSNTASVLVHEVDPYGEWVIASLNGDDMQQCEITEAEKDDAKSEEDVETGFFYDDIWVPMNQVMRV